METSAPSQLMKEGLLSIYQQLADELSVLQPVCQLSGCCCRFDEYGHRLYISRPEADLLLSEGIPQDSVVESGRCPFQKQNLCTAREKRPFGCRVFFCDPKYEGHAEQLSEKYLTQLKGLHHELNIPWEYAELHYFLDQHVAHQAVHTEQSARPST